MMGIVAPSQRSIHLIKAGGAVVTWGDLHCGGDSSSVHAALQEGVPQPQTAFVVAQLRSCEKSSSSHGPNIHSWSNLWTQVLSICGSYGSFAAVKGDGTVITWGDPTTGGDSSMVQPVRIPDADEWWMNEQCCDAVCQEQLSLEKAGVLILTWIAADSLKTQSLVALHVLSVKCCAHPSQLVFKGWML